MGIDDNMSIEELIEENKKLKELCDAYEEEHRTTFQEWVSDLNKLRKEHEFYETAMNIIEDMIKDLKSLSSEVEYDRRREEN